MANNPMAPAGRHKGSMMDRLRRLRSTTSLSIRGATSTSAEVVVPARRAAEAPKPAKPALKSKSKSRYWDEDLDLDKVNSKLEEYAQKCSQDEEHETNQVEEGQVKEATGTAEEGSEGHIGRGLGGRVKKSVDGGNTDTNKVSPMESTTSQQRSKTSGTCPSIIISPPDNEPSTKDTEPCDFQLFLQQAQVDESMRKKQGHVPKPKRHSSLNPFYSNNLASPSSANPPKLDGIQETGEGDDDTESSAAASSSQLTSSSGSSESNDFAATETRPKRANTTSLGRHVSFSEPKKTKERAVSHSSAYHGRGGESPEAIRSTGKRRSLHKIWQSIRQVGGVED